MRGKKKENVIDPLINFELAHYVIGGKGDSVERSVPDNCIEMILVHDGSVKFSIFDKVFQTCSLVLINPALEYSLEFSEETTYSSFLISKDLFKQIYFSEFFYVVNKYYKSFDGTLKYTILFREDYTQINNIFIMLNENFSSYNPGLLEKFTAAQILLLTNKIITNQEASELVEINQSQKFSLGEKISAYINDNLTGELSLQAICQIFGYSKYHISHVFKEEVGIPIGAYIAHRRIMLSQKYLLETEKSISEIASDLNFSSPSYFCTNFKKILGYSPSEYLRMAKNINSENKKTN